MGSKDLKELNDDSSCPCTYRQQVGGLPDWRAALSKRPAGGPSGVGRIRRDHELESVSRDCQDGQRLWWGCSSKACSAWSFLQVASGWTLQQLPNTHGQQKMEPGPFVVVYGCRVKHSRHKLYNINEMFRLGRGKSFFSTRTVPQVAQWFSIPGESTG